ncbi:hypothetical protein LT493_12375 [Streptomyces tricolor]|nr:hypothetical protein [Streptomyces tricolor]
MSIAPESSPSRAARRAVAATVLCSAALLHPALAAADDGPPAGVYRRPADHMADERHRLVAGRRAAVSSTSAEDLGLGTAVGRGTRRPRGTAPQLAAFDAVTGAPAAVRAVVHRRQGTVRALKTSPDGRVLYRGRFLQPGRIHRRGQRLSP